MAKEFRNIIKSWKNENRKLQWAKKRRHTKICPMGKYLQLNPKP
jgi:hypothetical protein